MVLPTLHPSRHISSTPISVDSAAVILDTYLTNAERHPHLHPDALITPAGVTFSSNSGSLGGVVMHHLRRIAGGLRGEYMAPEEPPADGEADEMQGFVSTEKQTKKRKRAEIQVDWQDKAEYEQEQGIEVGEVGDRNNAVQQLDEEPLVESMGGAPESTNGNQKVLDKEARKKAKKEKRKQEKKKREEAKQKQGEVGKENEEATRQKSESAEATDEETRKKRAKLERKQQKKRERDEARAKKTH